MYYSLNRFSISNPNHSPHLHFISLILLTRLSPSLTLISLTPLTRPLSLSHSRHSHHSLIPLTCYNRLPYSLASLSHPYHSPHSLTLSLYCSTYSFPSLSPISLFLSLSPYSCLPHSHSPSSHSQPTPTHTLIRLATHYLSLHTLSLSLSLPPNSLAPTFSLSPHSISLPRPTYTPLYLSRPTTSPNSLTPDSLSHYPLAPHSIFHTPLPCTPLTLSHSLAPLTHTTLSQSNLNKFVI